MILGSNFSKWMSIRWSKDVSSSLFQEYFNISCVRPLKSIWLNYLWISLTSEKDPISLKRAESVKFRKTGEIGWGLMYSVEWLCLLWGGNTLEEDKAAFLAGVKLGSTFLASWQGLSPFFGAMLACSTRTIIAVIPPSPCVVHCDLSTELSMD